MFANNNKLINLWKKMMEQYNEINNNNNNNLINNKDKNKNSNLDELSFVDVSKKKQW